MRSLEQSALTDLRAFEAGMPFGKMHPSTAEEAHSSPSCWRPYLYGTKTAAFPPNNERCKVSMDRRSETSPCCLQNAWKGQLHEEIKRGVGPSTIVIVNGASQLLSHTSPIFALQRAICWSPSYAFLGISHRSSYKKPTRRLHRIIACKSKGSPRLFGWRIFKGLFNSKLV